MRLFETEKSEKLSLKAFLATEQRIPGLGNGTLQDILWTAELHPKAKVDSLSSDDRQRLLNSIKNVLKNMADNGGRETERDLFGKAGEYTTKIGRTTYGAPSALDEAEGLRERIIWGKIYFCPKCQRI